MGARDKTEAPAVGEVASDTATTKDDGKGRRERRSTRDQIADAEKLLARLREQLRKEELQAREEFERELRKLLKSEGLDRFPIEAWAAASAKIKALLEATTAKASA